MVRPVGEPSSGFLINKEKLKKRKRTLGGHGNSWGNEKKIEVVTTYLVLGTGPLTAAATGVPLETIKQWRMQPWYKELEKEVRNEEDLELDTRLTKVVDRSIAAVQDRLENGDPYIDSKTGVIMRKPVLLRDAHKAMDVSLTKRDLLRRKPTRIVETRQIEDHLRNLADRFAEFVKFNRATVIDGTNTFLEDQPVTNVQVSSSG